MDEEGQQLGIVPTTEALGIAAERGLDLVEVAAGASPPVCRLLDYGKFLYERQKREREARKSQRSVEIKEMRLRPKTGEHDLATKLKKIRHFLGDGSKVKVRVYFRGREITHPELGKQLLDRVAETLKDVAVVEQPASMEGRTLLMLLAPANSKSG